MSTPKDGGPAFPGNFNHTHQGMTLRDWFAGHVLVDASHRYGHAPTAAAYAYKLADAMLTAREAGE